MFGEKKSVKQYVQRKEMMPCTSLAVQNNSVKSIRDQFSVKLSVGTER